MYFVPYLAKQRDTT